MRKIKIVLLFSLLAILTVSCKKSKNTPKAGPPAWDGRYSMTGTVKDNSDSRINPAGPKEYSLIPLANGKVDVLAKDLGFNGIIVKNIDNFTFFSNFGLTITIDPVTNKVTALTNSFGQPSSNGRSAVLDPSGVNAFDPVTKNLKIKYWMDEAGFTGHRVEFDNTFTYIGAR